MAALLAEDERRGGCRTGDECKYAPEHHRVAGLGLLSRGIDIGDGDGLAVAAAVDIEVVPAGNVGLLDSPCKLGVKAVKAALPAVL